MKKKSPPPHRDVRTHYVGDSCRPPHPRPTKPAGEYTQEERLEAVARVDRGEDIDWSPEPQTRANAPPEEPCAECSEGASSEHQEELHDEVRHLKTERDGWKAMVRNLVDNSPSPSWLRRMGYVDFPGILEIARAAVRSRGGTA
jgi:hypothetical protein